MRESDFRSEQDVLLLRMATEPSPQENWPAGCYGSRLAWLTFVGPSPGGGDGTEPEVPRGEQAETPLWNADYTEPCETWSPGFRLSTRTLVETITGRTQAEGAMKLYSFANFDWMPNPNAINVSAARMERGVPIVIEHLSYVKPRAIVTMESKAHEVLTGALKEAHYELRRPHFGQVHILRTRKGPSFHRSMEAYELIGAGPLSGMFVIRSPQHPARILDSDYADRIARAVRQTLVCLAERREPITLVYET